jgi:hypothetical protein
MSHQRKGFSGSRPRNNTQRIAGKRSDFEVGSRNTLIPRHCRMLAQGENAPTPWPHCRTKNQQNWASQDTALGNRRIGTPAPALVRFLDRYFYLSVSLLIAAVVAWGFRPHHQPEPYSSFPTRPSSRPSIPSPFQLGPALHPSIRTVRPIPALCLCHRKPKTLQDLAPGRFSAKTAK